MVERLIRNQQVRGSIPRVGSIAPWRTGLGNLACYAPFDFPRSFSHTFSRQPGYFPIPGQDPDPLSGVGGTVIRRFSKTKTLGAAMAGLLLLAFAVPTLGGSETESTVSLRWALGAIETGEATPSAIQRDTQLQGGDRLKFLVEPLSAGSVYLLLLDADEIVHVLYRESIEAEERAGPSYIPPGKQWFEVEDGSGLESFFLLAATEPLAELESLLDKYATAEEASKKEVGAEVIAEIRRQHRAHRQFSRPIEKPMLIGGQTRGGQAGASIDRLALEVTAERFYAKTITIEH